MESAFQIEFKLRQHTPIIHFQYDQEGATIRATELKPKLDRFILEKLGGYPSVVQSQPKWLVGNGDYPALDYKVKVHSSSRLDKTAIEYSSKQGKWRPNFPFVFGNVAREEEFKYLVQSDQATVTITCRHVDLLSEINNSFCSFLEYNNFGFRQSKGFGSFYLIESDEYYSPPMSKYHFTVDTSKGNNEFDKSKELFQVIELLYKTLRSGINTSNFGGIYFKSLMFMYAKSTAVDQQWDKRTIRECLYANHPTYNSVKLKRTDTNGTVQYKAAKQDNLLFRDLLGLSTDQDWMGYGKAKTDNDGDPILKNGKPEYKSDSISKKSISGEIDRFQSPIMFTPIRRRGTNIFDVYIVPKLVPQMYFGQTFTIKSHVYPTNNFNMAIPQTFVVKDYLDFCFKTIFPMDKDFKSHVSNANNPDAIKLLSIFSELRNC